MTDSTRQLLADAARRGADYLEALDGRPVFPREADVERLRGALAGEMPSGPAGGAEVLAFLDKYGSPATVASAGGRYFGFVTGGALPATLAAHVLATAWDQNSFSFISSPAASLFERSALRWLKDVFGLPAESVGAFVLGATMANFAGLAAARHAVLRRAGWNVEEQGLRGSPEVTLVVGEEAHGTILKVLPLLGFGRAHVHRVPADGQGRMRAERPSAHHRPDHRVHPGRQREFRRIRSRRARSSGVARGAAPGCTWTARSGCGPRPRPAPALMAGLRATPIPGRPTRTSGSTCPTTAASPSFATPCAASRHGRSAATTCMIGSADPIDLPRTARGGRAASTSGRRFSRSAGAALPSSSIATATRPHGSARKLRRAGIEVLNEVVLNQVRRRLRQRRADPGVDRGVQEAGDCWCGGTRWHGREAMRVSVSAWATTQADMERTLRSILAAAEIPG